MSLVVLLCWVVFSSCFVLVLGFVVLACLVLGGISYWLWCLVVLFCFGFVLCVMFEREVLLLGCWWGCLVVWFVCGFDFVFVGLRLCVVLLCVVCWVGWMGFNLVGGLGWLFGFGGVWFLGFVC